jgi:hypothetical protein
MTAPRISLTLEVQSAICGFILSGSYAHVAAEAAGVPRKVFDDWMKRGRLARSAKKYRTFRAAVLQAQAQARLAAEARTMTDDPLAWLKSGPGKETPESPGWSNPGRSAATKEGGQWLMQTEFQELIATLLQVLQPYPEVRVAVAEALAQLEQQQNAAPPPAEEE